MWLLGVLEASHLAFVVRLGHEASRDTLAGDVCMRSRLLLLPFAIFEPFQLLCHVLFLDAVADHCQVVRMLVPSLELLQLFGHMTHRHRLECLRVTRCIRPIATIVRAVT
jgi:hypothetical protein